MFRILFVCLGNICRSPMAHGAFDALVEERQCGEGIRVDSCGTSAHHVGEAPDPTMTRVALEQGIDLRSLRSRRLSDTDFYDFDLLVAMDRANEADILALRPGDSQAEVVRFMSFVPDADGDDVPDPWWAGRIEGFEEVCSLVQRGVQPLLDHVLSLRSR